MLSLDNSYLRLIHGGPVLNLKASQSNYHFPTIMELHGMWPRLELGNRCIGNLIVWFREYLCKRCKWEWMKKLYYDRAYLCLYDDQKHTLLHQLQGCIELWGTVVSSMKEIKVLFFKVLYMILNNDASVKVEKPLHHLACLLSAFRHSSHTLKESPLLWKYVLDPI